MLCLRRINRIGWTLVCKSGPYAGNTVRGSFPPCRRLQQFEAAGDRNDILAKLQGRSCRMPFVEVVASPYLNKFLLCDCNNRPHGADTL